MKKGLLLLNLGTPASLTLSEVRRYLRAFLSDKRVVTLAAPMRYALLYGIIVPFRSQKTLKAYRSIWDKQGSPLLLHSMNLLKGLQEKLGDQYTIALGMRYGEPSIENALMTLNSCDELFILPLFPQYASATTGSALEKTLELIAQSPFIPTCHILRDFYATPEYIHAQASLIKPYLTAEDHVLFSYHGLPEQHLEAAGCITPCAAECPAHISSRTPCYRAQCLQTSSLIAQALQLHSKRYTSSFQSRVGAQAWIKPYTEDILDTLFAQGVRRLIVTCPSFVADCLETLEEIGIRLRKAWLDKKDTHFTLVPSLNNHPTWIHAITKLLPTTES